MICRNKGQVCHFLTPPRILLFLLLLAERSDTQEMLLTSLADAPNPLERALGQGSGDT